MGCKMTGCGHGSTEDQGTGLSPAHLPSLPTTVLLISLQSHPSPMLSPPIPPPHSRLLLGLQIGSVWCVTEAGAHSRREQWSIVGGTGSLRRQPGHKHKQQLFQMIDDLCMPVLLAAQAFGSRHHWKQSSLNIRCLTGSCTCHVGV